MWRGEGQLCYAPCHEHIYRHEQLTFVINVIFLLFIHLYYGIVCIVYRYALLNEVIRSEKCVVRQFRRCANVIEWTDTNIDSVASYTPGLYIAYCS